MSIKLYINCVYIEYTKKKKYTFYETNNHLLINLLLKDDNLLTQSHILRFNLLDNLSMFLN